MNYKRRGPLALVLTLVCFPACAQVPPEAAKPATPAPPVAAVPAAAPNLGPFLVKPYIQLGNAPAAAEKENLLLLWQTDDGDAANWQVETKVAGKWTPTDAPVMRRVAVPGANVYRIYTDTLTGLTPGAGVAYHVLKNGAEVFTANAIARKAATANTHFAVFGDCGENTPGEKAIAYQVYKDKPDYVFIVGDIVYKEGLMQQYYEKFFPIYNADKPDPAVGAPLIRSTLFLAAPGNHDTNDAPDLNEYPDGLAYFLSWAQPLNGPLTAPDAKSAPPIAGDGLKQSAFIDAAAGTFPRMANFSYDYGTAHWLVLDANPYTDWTDKKLRDWVENDLAAAKNANWRFVAFHQPPFKSSAKTKKMEQWMRVLTDLFEKYKVDIVFSGHVHNYQRTHPLHFAIKSGDRGALVDEDGAVNGTITLDTVYDGVKHTKANGVIYIITGGGGAHLSEPEFGDDPKDWQDYTVKLYSKGFSYTAVDIKGKTLTARQISDAGVELDRYVITK